jgi:hypothetical protein
MTVKNTLGGCFFVLVFLNLSLRTGLILPYMLGLDVISFSISMSLLFFCLLVFKIIIIIIIVGEDAEFLFFLLIAFQILYMFLLDISIHYALIEYAYI